MNPNPSTANPNPSTRVPPSPNSATVALRQKQTQIDSLTAELASLKSSANVAKRRIQDFQTQLDSAVAARDSARAQLAAANERESKLRKQLADAIESSSANVGLASNELSHETMLQEKGAAEDSAAALALARAAAEAAEAACRTARVELATTQAELSSITTLHRAATTEIDELRAQLALAKDGGGDPHDGDLEDERATLRVALSEARIRIADVEHEAHMLQQALAAAESARDAMLSEKESRIAQTTRMLDELKDARRRAEQLEAEKRQLGTVVAAARAAEQAAEEAAEASRGAATNERERLAELEAQLGALHSAAAGVAAEGELHADALRREADRLRVELADAMASIEARRDEMAHMRAEATQREAAHRNALRERDEAASAAQSDLFQQVSSERERAEHAHRQARLVEEKLRTAVGQLALRGIGVDGSSESGGGAMAGGGMSTVQRIATVLEQKWVIALVIFVVPTLFWLLTRRHSSAREVEG
jgi:chromosome segregation ATPase